VSDACRREKRRLRYLWWSTAADCVAPFDDRYRRFRDLTSKNVCFDFESARLGIRAAASEFEAAASRPRQPNDRVDFELAASRHTGCRCCPFRRCRRPASCRNGQCLTTRTARSRAGEHVRDGLREFNGRPPTPEETRKHLAFDRLAKSSSLDPATLLLIFDTGCRSNDDDRAAQLARIETLLRRNVKTAVEPLMGGPTRDLIVSAITWRRSSAVADDEVKTRFGILSTLSGGG
jgi:hypothetical protein